jgi:hypothetical protein
MKKPANKNSRTNVDFPDHEAQPMKQPIQTDEQMSSAKVAAGRSVHIPTGERRVVGSRPWQTADGSILHIDVYAGEFRNAGPGEVVTLPQAEINRMISLGFLVPLGKQTIGMAIKQGRPETGVDGDPRVTAAR